MTKTFVAAMLTLAASTVLQAGGFWLQTANPEANAEAKALNAVAIVRVVGCHDPQQATVTGNSIGVTDGKRVSNPLKLVKLSIPGAYAVTRQWPAEGRWALEFVATTGDLVTSLVMPATGDNVDRQAGKYNPGRPAPGDIDAVLAGAR